jgi:thiamine transport system permease protein
LITSLELLGTTALIAILSAAGSAVLGYPAGNWLASSPQWVRTLLTPWLLLPFLLPPFLIGISLLPLQQANINSQTGILWVVAAHLIMNIGFMARVTASLAVPAEQLEAAELDRASKWQVRLVIELPQQLPGIAAAALLVALYSATSYGLVISLGRGKVHTLETEIVQLSLRELDLSGAALLALLQTLLTFVMFWLASRLGANPTPLFGYERSRGSWLGLAIALVAVSAVIWIVFAIANRAFALNGGIGNNITALGSQGSRDVLNVTVLEAAGNSLRNLALTLLIALPMAWFAAGRAKSSALWLLPIGISPVVVGLLFLVGSGYLPQSLVGWWLLPLAQAIFVVPLGYQILRPARASLPAEYLESARLDGASRVQAFQLIELPVLAKPLATAVAFSALGSLGEFGAASFLAYGSQTTLPLAIFRLASRPGAENLGMAMTASLLLLSLALVVVYFIAREARTELARQ